MATSFKNVSNQIVSNQSVETGEEPIADSILRAIRRILRKTAEHSRQISSDGGLSVPQLLCLRRVAESSTAAPVTVAQVASAVQLSSATVSRILDRLEADKLIDRERSTEDRRKVYLRITPLGKRRVKSLPTPLQEQFLGRLSELSRHEQQSLLASLEQLVEMMGAEELDAAPLLVPDADVTSSAN